MKAFGSATHSLHLVRRVQRPELVRATGLRITFSRVAGRNWPELAALAKTRNGFFKVFSRFL